METRSSPSLEVLVGLVSLGQNVTIEPRWALAQLAVPEKGLTLVCVLGIIPPANKWCYVSCFFPAITMGFKQTSPIRCSVWCDENEEGAESIFLRQAPTPHPNVVAPRGSYVYFSSLWESVHALYFSFSHTHTPRLLV